MSVGGLKVFISYRRSDAQGYAGWLAQLLAERYGASNVFRDVGSIKGGEHFPTRIAKTLSGCDAALVLIGPTWLAADEAGGHSRLDDPEDWVRIEVESILEKGVAVVPALIGGAAMPDPPLLPPTLRRLTESHALQLRDESFV